ncbi:YczE/YyaS/YitT family protein [Enterocloster citroniae]
MGKGKTAAKRAVIYLFGIVMVSLGIILCKKSNLGISPISSIPYVLEETMPFTFGTLTMMFHMANIILQMIVVRRIWDIKILLQVPVAFLFGQVIDFLQRVVVFDETIVVYQGAALLLSIIFTALGMVCMINMNLVQNPPDGFVRQLSRKIHVELGTVKIYYDISCVVISAALGLLCLHRVKGFGIATLASAVCVGRAVTWMKTAADRAVRCRSQ